MRETFFVQLPGVNTTLNLACIAAVEWGQPEGLPGYGGTVFLVNGHQTYLTSKDTEILWKALQAYNHRTVKPVEPRPLVQQEG